MPQSRKEPEFDTIQVHGGQIPDPTTKARAPPIYASASFSFNDSAHGANMFAGKEAGFVYSRFSNPTVEVFEKRIALLERGVGAVATASGQSAQFLAISALAQAGDNFVSSSFLFGGTYNQFKVTFKHYGIGVKWVTENNLEAFAAAIDDRTKAIFVESISNPKYIFVDIPALAKIAHDHGIPLIVDNTFGAGGYIIQPIKYGADIVVHSATKWIGGHGTTLAGVVIDSGNFDWAKSDKFPGLSGGDLGGRTARLLLHRLIFSRCDRYFMRDIGPALNPFGAFLLLQGLETLSLRVQRHSENALALALWLEQHPQVAWVSYLGLPSHESHEVAQQLARPNAFGGMLSFGLKGDLGVLYKVLDSLELASNLANVGDAKTLVLHPASIFSSAMNAEEQLVFGVTPDMIRVSVGIEDVKDIIADFDVAINTVFGTPA